jgi:hypothetical protein
MRREIGFGEISNAQQVKLAVENRAGSKNLRSRIGPMLAILINGWRIALIRKLGGKGGGDYGDYES